MGKRKGGDEDDRLSELPDSLILYILSLINNEDPFNPYTTKSNNSKQVIRTCVLSKRWKSMWTRMSKLDFYHNRREPEKITSFVNWVGKMLDKCPVSHNFSVGFKYHQSFAPNISNWLRIAVERDVKDISLYCFDAEFQSYDLPRILYSHSSLTSLTLRYCAINIPRELTVNWKSLKTLSIEYVRLSDCLMEKILSSCPVLEALHLKNCVGLSCLNILSSTLIILEIIVGEMKPISIDISAPLLLELSVTGYAEMIKFMFGDISSLVQASLNFYDNYISEMFSMMQLLQSLQHVKGLKLGQWCFEVISFMEVQGFDIPLSTCCCLTLEITSDVRISIPGILCILKSYPYLETLVINVKDYRKICHHNLDLAASYSKKANFDLECGHLKTIKFIGINSNARKVVTRLAKYLLKSAIVLQKMVISKEKYVAPEIFEKVRTFKKASPEAVVVVC